MLKLGIWATAIVLGWAAAASAEEPALQGEPYTLGVCPITGEPLGSMGDPVVFMHEGRQVKFCCAACEPRFKGDLTKGMAKVDTLMIADQRPHYPLATDIVTGEALPADDKVIDVVHFNRLARFGSQKSAQTFMKDPDTYLAKLNEAVIAKQKDAYPLDKCIVSGEMLTGTSDIQRVFASRLVEFCCDHCVDSFAANPAKYISALDKGEIPAGASHEAVHGEHQK